MLINRVGSLKCKTAIGGGYNSIKWLNADSVALSSEENTVGSEITISTRITFEEWTNGTKFTCEVDNSDFVQKFKRIDYQRENGRECFYYLYVFFIFAIPTKL